MSSFSLRTLLYMETNNRRTVRNEKDPTEKFQLFHFLRR
ncbi:hypothetical protein B4135_1234 [Caldibacillus debilis]|uniref:Uncharacterized protein n=1 Tax=Caldibacillus debilis TaxID=301148 RepID=A0A150MCX9_9BACI|nr:hypothetical protein B4135_1234 [Caldibacillus debilis]